jgi:membrane protein implicated in regulation of membrane protease activity
MKKTPKELFNTAFSKLLVALFALCWLMIIFKTFKIGFMKTLPWITVTYPMLFFIIASVGYVVVLYTFLMYEKHSKPKHKRRFSEEKILNRQMELAKEPTKIKDGMMKAIALFVGILLAYFILHICI